MLTVTKPEGGTISGSGINCGTGGSDCTTTFAKGDPVDLRAEPDAGFLFSGFTGDCKQGGRTIMSAGADVRRNLYQDSRRGRDAHVHPDDRHAQGRHDRQRRDHVRDDGCRVHDEPSAGQAGSDEGAGGSGVHVQRIRRRGLLALWRDGHERRPDAAARSSSRMRRGRGQHGIVWRGRRRASGSVKRHHSLSRRKSSGASGAGGTSAGGGGGSGTIPPSNAGTIPGAGPTTAGPEPAKPLPPPPTADGIARDEIKDLLEGVQDRLGITGRQRKSSGSIQAAPVGEAEVRVQPVEVGRVRGYEGEPEFVDLDPATGDRNRQRLARP